MSTAVCAGLIGRSVWTLQRARHDRVDLDMPQHVLVGKRSVRYPLSLVFEWARRRGVRLCWADCPMSVVLPVFGIYESQALRVPADLAEIAGRVRKGR